MDKTTSSTESTRKLRDAMRKLEAYTLQQMELTDTSSVSKTISLVRSILISPFESKPKKHRHQRHPPNKNEVLIAVELINRNRLFIEKLKEGTPAEQELAEQFTQTINTYNESCDKRIQGCVSNRERLAKFFSKDKHGHQELPKIALPKKVSIQHHYPEHLSPTTLKLSAKSEIPVPMSKQSAELFHMKAIALLERYGIASNPEARTFVKQSPIHTAIQEDASICTLTQTLSLFPGQTIVVMGTSALDPKTHAISQLFPETFYLSLESTQTGFPHPIQRAGWTVAGQLLPDSPQRIDLLNLSTELFQRRNAMIAGLEPQGSLLKHAKQLLSFKKKAFDQHAEELIQLHRKLSLTILEKSCANADAYEITEKFYDALGSRPTPFDFLAETWHLVREHFMVRPHQQLLDAIIKGKSTDFGSPISETRHLAAKELLNESLELAQEEILRQKEETKLLNEKSKYDFMRVFGNILGTASNQIFLQYLSEDLMFLPPSLNSFESKVQIAAYHHLKDFLAELSLSLSGDLASDQKLAYQLLKDQITSDIALFHEETLHPISKELSEYFQNRYVSLSSL